MTAEVFHQKDTTYLSLSNWEVLINNLIVGFSTKSGGLSCPPYTSLNLGLHVNDQSKSVVENRKVLSKSTSFPIKNWVFAEQIHSTHITKVIKSDRGRGVHTYEDTIQSCDGLYTNEKGIMLSLCFADCVPLYFIAPNKSLIGLAHAGWKGTVQDIGGKMVRKWKNVEGVNPNEIKVAIGPAIGSCCYVVDNKVISAINKEIVDKYPSPYTIVSEGQYTLDLKQLNKSLLLEAGVKEENIIISQHCTSCEKEMFFSYRRDQGKTGRMLSFIGINEEA